MMNWRPALRTNASLPASLRCGLAPPLLCSRVVGRGAGALIVEPSLRSVEPSRRSVGPSCRSAAERLAHRVSHDDVLDVDRATQRLDRFVRPDPAAGHGRARTQFVVLTFAEKRANVENVVEEGNAAFAAQRTVCLEHGHLLGEIGIAKRFA